MKNKILITALIAIGFSLSGVSHAAPQMVTKPDGSKVMANVEGNTLKLQAGKLWVPAGDGTYRTSDGKTIIVKGGIVGPLDNKDKTGVIAPMFNPAAQSGNAGAPTGNNGKGNIVGPMFTPPAVQSGNAAAPRIDAGANAPKLNPAKVPEGNTSGLPRAPGVVAHPTAGCPDPAITELLIRLANRNADGTYNFTLIAVIKNKGSVPFISRRDQQSITFSEGGRVLQSEPWGTPQFGFAAGESDPQYVQRVARWNPSAKPLLGFTAEITYDPDIFIDGNPQNDDCNMSNNKLSLSVDEALRQLAGAPLR